MAEIKIAIISKNKSLSRFIALEAENCDIRPVILDKYSPQASNCHFTVVDIDAVRQISNFDIKNSLIVSRGQELPSSCQDAKVLFWPIRVNELKSIFEELKNQVNSHKPIEEHENENVIYFFKDAINTVRYNQKNLTLSEYEMRILELLCKNCGRSVSREALNGVLGASKGNIADVYVCKLRKKLENEGIRLIFTVRFEGYKITVPMEWK